MHERKSNLVVRVDSVELDMAHAVAGSRDVPIAQVIRDFIRNAYSALYGTAPPPPRKRRRIGDQQRSRNEVGPAAQLTPGPRDRHLKERHR